MGSGTGFSVPRSFEVVQLEGGVPGQIVVAGSQTALATPVVLPAPPEIYDFPGAPFVIRSSSPDTVLASKVLRPLVRYGTPGRIGTEATLGHGSVDSARVRVGSDAFTVATALTISTLGPTPGPAYPFHGYLAIGFGIRGQGAPADPVTINGAQAMLQPALVLEFPALQRVLDESFLSTQLAIPGDPGLEGLVVLFQWFIQSATNADEIAYSEVFATRVWGAGDVPSGALATSGPSPTSPLPGPNLGSPAASTAVRNAAKAAWLATLGQRNAPGSAARFQQLRARLPN